MFRARRLSPALGCFIFASRSANYGAYRDGVVYVIISENNPRNSEKLETFVEEFKTDLYQSAPAGQAELSFVEKSASTTSGARDTVSDCEAWTA